MDLENDEGVWGGKGNSVGMSGGQFECQLLINMEKILSFTKAVFYYKLYYIEFWFCTKIYRIIE